MTSYLATIRIEAFGLAEAKELAQGVTMHAWGEVVSVVQEPAPHSVYTCSDVDCPVHPLAAWSVPPEQRRSVVDIIKQMGVTVGASESPPKQPCPRCGELREVEMIRVPTGDDIDRGWVPGAIKCECFYLLGSDEGGPVNREDHSLPSEPPRYVTTAIEAAKSELRAEADITYRSLMDAMDEKIASYFRQCLAEQDGKWCGLRNHHKIPHHFFLPAPEG